MNNFRINIDAIAYKRVHKKLSQYNIKIGGMSIRNFLIANTVNEDADDTAENRTKRIILHISGDFESKLSIISDETSLIDDLKYGHHEYLMLRRRLDLLAKEYDTLLKITAVEINECRNVGDCLALINSKISISMDSLYME